MKLYNQSAHEYKLNKTQYIDFMMKSAGFCHENRNYYSADANELAYKLWSAYEEMYPIHNSQFAIRNSQLLIYD